MGADPIENFLGLVGALVSSFDFTQVLVSMALILARVAPVVVMTPYLGGRLTPPELKMGLVLGLTLILFPLASGSLSGPLPITIGAFLVLFMKEIFIGFSLGFINAHIFWAVEMTGRIIDTVRGSSMAEVLVPGSQRRATPTGNLFYNLLVVIFVVVAGHQIFLEAFFFSFKSLPLDMSPNFQSGPFYEHIILLTNQMFFIAAILSAPVVAATFITDVVFGILNRVAPQLNAYFMSMPVKAMAGVIMVLVAFYPFVARLRDFVVWSIQAVESALHYLAA
jgi:flagellar biosynthetic protein FliR